MMLIALVGLMALLMFGLWCDYDNYRDEQRQKRAYRERQWRSGDIANGPDVAVDRG